mmetsp:Transcript_16113/g.36118  ORF Transcript_16113/g.36118 Transcript_16113/m.36118 type:complete len:97 (+) Transcript_16113:541-831(+)
MSAMALATPHPFSFLLHLLCADSGAQRQSMLQHASRKRMHGTLAVVGDPGSAGPNAMAGVDHNALTLLHMIDAHRSWRPLSHVFHVSALRGERQRG